MKANLLATAAALWLALSAPANAITLLNSDLIPLPGTSGDLSLWVQHLNIQSDSETWGSVGAAFGTIGSLNDCSSLCRHPSWAVRVEPGEFIADTGLLGPYVISIPFGTTVLAFQWDRQIILIMEPLAETRIWWEFTPSPIPLPGALPLFATGLGVLGLLGWRRKRHGT